MAQHILKQQHLNPLPPLKTHCAATSITGSAEGLAKILFTNGTCSAPNPLFPGLSIFGGWVGGHQPGGACWVWDLSACWVGEGLMGGVYAVWGVCLCAGWVGGARLWWCWAILPQAKWRGGRDVPQNLCTPQLRAWGHQQANTNTTAGVSHSTMLPPATLPPPPTSCRRPLYQGVHPPTHLHPRMDMRCAGGWALRVLW